MPGHITKDFAAHFQTPAMVAVDDSSPTFLFVRVHLKGVPAFMDAITLYLHNATPAERAAWQTLADTLAALDVKEGAA